MKIFLVEDEVPALRSLQQKIEDLHDDWEIVGTAFNGAQALEKISNCHPDILLTDIRMPDMDGIALIEALHARQIDTVVVIISGYREFDYAQQAVRLGVKDYLLKPVDPAQLQQSLNNCRTQLEARRNKVTIQGFLTNSLAHPIIYPSSALCYCAYLVVANALSDSEYLQHPVVPRLLASQVQSIASAYAPSHVSLRCVDGFFSNEKALFSIVSKEKLSEKSIQDSLTNFANELSAVTQTSVTIFYKICDTLNHLDDSISACRKGALESIILGKTIVTCNPPAERRPDPNLEEHIRLIGIFLRQNQSQELKKYTLKMLQKWETDNRTAVEIQTDLVFMLSSLQQLMSNRQSHTFNAVFYIENLFCFSKTHSELAENLYQLLIELFTIPETENMRSGDKLVNQIDAYFEANIADNISLQMLADEFSISKVYLCRIFKRTKNTTPMDYFMHLKIERAKQMLTSYPDMPLREIAQALGFNDIYYFSKVFKRIVGMPPSEFRTKF